MSLLRNSKLTRYLAQLIGDFLIKLKPKRASELSKNRLTLVHMDKKNLSIIDRLMRYSLVQKLEKIEDPNKIEELNRNFWQDKKATDFFLETDDRFVDDFLPNCSFIFDILKEELKNTPQQYKRFVEIGTGTGNVLNYLYEQFPEMDNFVGIDLSEDQVKINNEKYQGNQKINFVAADGFEWVKNNGQSNTIFVTSRGVLEYFLEERLLQFLKTVHALGPVIFVSIEPNGADHDFDKNPNTQIYGSEPSFSHNYPKLFQDAGFKLWHFSQKQWAGGGGKQTFIGAID